jgi:hypothetical protein
MVASVYVVLLTAQTYVAFAWSTVKKITFEVSESKIVKVILAEVR